MSNIENILRKDLGFKPFKESLGHNVNKIKPFNSFRYAEALAIISGDKFIQENTTLHLAYGYSEAKKEGDAGAMKKFGNKIVAYAKDTWKVIKVLIGKLVIFLEESIAKLFDKTKKTEKLLKTFQQLIKDNSDKMSESIEFEVSHPKFLELTEKSYGDISGEFENIEDFFKDVRNIKASDVNMDELYNTVENASKGSLKYSKDWKELKKDIKDLMTNPTNTKPTAADVKSIFTDEGLSKFIKHTFAFVGYVINKEKEYKDEKNKFEMKTTSVNFNSHEGMLESLTIYAKLLVQEVVSNRKVYFEQKKLGLRIKNMPEKRLANFETANLTALRKMININSKYSHNLNKMSEYQLSLVNKALGQTYKSLNKALKTAKKK